MDTSARKGPPGWTLSPHRFFSSTPRLAGQIGPGGPLHPPRGRLAISRIPPHNAAEAEYPLAAAASGGARCIPAGGQIRWAYHVPSQFQRSACHAQDPPEPGAPAHGLRALCRDSCQLAAHGPCCTPWHVGHHPHRPDRLVGVHPDASTSRGAHAACRNLSVEHGHRGPNQDGPETPRERSRGR